MASAQTLAQKPEPDTAVEFDAIVIGAGVAGLYQLYKLRELGLRVRVFEAGTGVGGTWYWNRYPGARFNSESWTYGYSFSQELLEEWNWQEHFAPSRRPSAISTMSPTSSTCAATSSSTAASPPRITRKTRAAGMSRWRTAGAIRRAFWSPRSASCRRRRCRTFPASTRFKGQSCHTHAWPKEGVDFAGKRVGIIGTGATAVQTIQEIAKTVGHLTVFQRTPNWCAPLHNGKISSAEMDDIRARYREIFALCQNLAGLLHPCPGPAQDPEVTARGARGLLGKALRLAGFRHLDGAISATC